MSQFLIPDSQRTQVGCATGHSASPSMADDARGGQRPHFPHSRLLQHPRARFERRAGRAHVVHEDHDRPDERGGRAGDGKRIADVAMTLRRGQVGLRGGRADAPQRRVRPDVAGGAARSCRLIEAALPPARRVERDRERRRRRPRGGRRPRMRIRPRQRPGQRSASLVFESVDDRPQRSVVGANRARPIDEARSATAARAARQRHADRTPGRQRIAAPIAERRCQRQNRRPARRAHRTARRLFEQTVAGGAGWRQDDGENGIECRARCAGDWVNRSHRSQSSGAETRRRAVPGGCAIASARRRSRCDRRCPTAARGRRRAAFRSRRCAR